MNKKLVQTAVWNRHRNVIKAFNVYNYKSVAELEAAMREFCRKRKAYGITYVYDDNSSISELVENIYNFD